MRATASISEPFVLSTYGTSHQLPRTVTNKKTKGPASVFATHETASGSSDGYATITAQADGIHILDVSTLHPVISHTLGPSTTFSCPAITRNTVQGADNLCTTYAAIESSADITSEESGRTIWMWSENLSSRLIDRASGQSKKSIVIPHQISGLYTCNETPSRLFVRSPETQVTVMDADLNIKSTWSPSENAQSILRTFVYSRRSCSFVPSQSIPSRGAILVFLVTTGEGVSVQILSVDDKDNFLELGKCAIPLKSDQILDVSCNSIGHMSFLARDGAWHSYLLESTNGTSVKLSSVAEPFCLTGFSFVSKPQNSEEISLLSTTSSHVLLSALTNSPTPEIVLLLWDLQYSVLLASQALPVPSSLSQSKELTIKLNLVQATNSQALLLLSPHTPNTGRKPEATPSRSNVLAVPFVSPPVSTIANAMGQASVGAKWIDQATTSGSTSISQPSHDPTRSKILKTMRAAMDKNLPQAANVAFFEWEKRESKPAAVDAPASLPTLNDSFVKDLLAIVLQPSKPANTPYSSEVVRYLLNRQLVSDSMVEGGLLAALRYRNDWQTIGIALAKVLDIPEAEILESLRPVVVRHRQSNPAAAESSDAMEVESISELPPLPEFLSSCVTYTTSPAALRSAMRHYLQDADDILSVVNVLEDWIKQWSKRDVRLLPSKKDVSNNESGIPVLKARERAVNRDLPPLNKVLDFLQTLLDASFLTLLAHPPAHRVLRNIHSLIEPEIAYIDELEQLRGPLESFAKAHTKAVKEGGQDKRKKVVGDWRQRRKQAHEQAGLSIGLYQLEELVL